MLPSRPGGETLPGGDESKLRDDLPRRLGFVPSCLQHPNASPLLPSARTNWGSITSPVAPVALGTDNDSVFEIALGVGEPVAPAAVAPVDGGEYEVAAFVPFVPRVLPSTGYSVVSNLSSAAVGIASNGNYSP
ncbi:unnamed protein product [Agarophyton chilense]|eukprot:gb/GEZJ01006317.1/.p2 GENE.gb/GEZJ01006317.1/~~gb/GEZJ01006317.1/.p2  ORF type:complete len:133 (+),score=10.00 gb/GEZJ01006317.1/:135-533(+)